MRRYDDFRSSSGDLGYGGGQGGGGGGRGAGGRWDRERFHVERERDRFAAPPAPRAPVMERPYERRFEEDIERRGPRYEEDERFIVKERFGPPARRPERRYYDDELAYGEDSPPAGGQMIPFRSRGRGNSTYSREFEPRNRASPRPGLLRRQSSLDTFDRRPAQRYYERDEYRETIPVPVPPRRPSPPPRFEAPPPPRFAERDFEEIRIAEPDYYGDEEFRGFRERERTTVRRRRSSSRHYEPRERESFEEVEAVEEEKPFPRRGKTRMPKRLVHTRAIIELGYPFEEEVSVGESSGLTGH